MKRVVPAVALLALALPATAAAHANLVRTDPASGEVLARSPGYVQVVFDDVVRVGPGNSVVRNGGGPVLRGPATTRGDTLTIPLRAHLPNGDYSVRWSIISDDGHLESGVLAFGVGEGRAPPTAVLKAEATGPGAGTATRWLFLAGVLGAVGISLYALVVLRRPEEDAAQRVAVVLGVAAVLVAIGAGIEAHRVGLETRYGAAMGAGFALGGLVAAGAIVALRPALWLAVGLAAVPSVSGHALDPGLPRISVAIDVVHVLAASAWVGVLLGLVVLGVGETRRAALLAAAGVVAVGITGALRAGFELTSASQLWDTSYGRTILIKTGIALGATGVGWLLRAHARRRATFELALVAGLVVAVAVLVQLRPGRNYLPVSSPIAALEPSPNPPPPPPGAVVLGREAGPLAIALEAEPHRLTVVVLSPAGGGLSGLRVRYLPAGVTAKPCGSGCYRADAAPGQSVTVAVDGFGPHRTAAFRLPRNAPDATAIVRRYERAYRSRPGVTLDESLGSNSTNALVARWRLESPDRLAYTVKGAASGIVIGKRRWDRDSPRGPWQQSVQDPRLPEPATLWQRVTNAHVLRVRGNLETVSFADPSLGAFFLLTFDRRTLLPRVVHMLASAHFMTDRYLGFSPAREIRPPR